jgi:hypothetical protein
MTVLSYWIRTYGIPQDLYCDRKNAFVITREPTEAELKKGDNETEKPFWEGVRKTGDRSYSGEQPAG